MINRSKLSSKENRARTKFIQEYHYTKTEQKIFDQYVAFSDRTYSQIYKSAAERGSVFAFMLQIGTNRMAEAMVRASYSASVASEALRRIFNVMQEVL